MATHDTDLPGYELNDGARLPQIGFGTYPLKGAEGIAAMLSALQAGYRLLDTAVNYENESEVGEALRRSGLPRDAVQVATKVPGRFHERELAIRSVEDSLSRLGLEQLDLVLIHWPNPSVGRHVEAWEALVECRERGLTRSIGVSNFTASHLADLIEATSVTPAVNQVEMHPYFPQDDMRQVHARLGILTQAWSPLGKNPRLLEEPPVVASAQAHGVTPAQAVLRWQLQLGALPLPKSGSAQRQRENLDLLGFELTAEQMDAIAALARADGRRFGGDPNTHEEQ